MSDKNPTFIVIDANALLHRSFHALPPLRTSDGQMTNAVFGFLTVFFKVLKEYKADYIVAAFDKDKKTFRHKEYKEYKAGRAEAPDELYEQFPIAKDFLEKLNVPVFEKSGYEADDIIGTISALNEKEGIKTVIVTGDKDSYQLISDRTVVHTLRKGVGDTVTYDRKAFRQKYDLKPSQVVDFKAIAGDASDNIPGVKGIGEKGATQLLKQFGTLERIYKELEKKSGKPKIPARYIPLLKKHKKDAFLSQKLARIVRDVPLSFDRENCAYGGYDDQSLIDLFQKYEMRSLLSRLPLQDKKTSSGSSSDTDRHADTNSSYVLVNDASRFADFLSQLKKQKKIALDSESTSVSPFRAKLLGMSFCWKEGRAYYVNVKDNPEWLKSLKPILESEEVRKYGHNIKYDIALLRQYGCEIRPVRFDSMVGSYLLKPGSRGHSLDNLALEVFSYRMQPLTDLIGKGKKQIPMDMIPLEKLSWYACEDADYTFRLCTYYETELKEQGLLKLNKTIELPLIPVLARLEENGVKIDKDFLATLSREIGHKIELLEKKIHKHAGSDFNINSPIQLKEVLFEDLGIPTDGISKTKTGFSTAAAELEKMREEHPIIPLLIEYRELTKLQSTYLEALPKLINPKTNRVHTSFNQTITATGRLSSSDPNLQNIPIRREEGRKIRKAFIADRGFRIVAADYSQIELRVIASLANDEKMIESFKKDEDIHRRTAAEVYGIPLEEVTREQRYEAKEVNFGILYGMGAWGLASRKNMSRERAQAFIEKYFYAHQAIQEFIAQTIQTAHEQEYVETLFGRRRNLPDISASNPRIRAAAERMAINMPVQGTAADLMKMAMIEIHAKLPQVSPKTRMILQVHDELVFEVPTNEVSSVGAFIAEEMNSVYRLKAPIKTDVAVGASWGDMKSLPV